MAWPCTFKTAFGMGVVDVGVPLNRICFCGSFSLQLSCVPSTSSSFFSISIKPFQHYVTQFSEERTQTETKFPVCASLIHISCDTISSPHHVSVLLLRKLKGGGKKKGWCQLICWQGSATLQKNADHPLSALGCCVSQWKPNCSSPHHCQGRHCNVLVFFAFFSHSASSLDSCPHSFTHKYMNMRPLHI